MWSWYLGFDWIAKPREHLFHEQCSPVPCTYAKARWLLSWGLQERNKSWQPIGNESKQWLVFQNHCRLFRCFLQFSLNNSMLTSLNLLYFMFGWKSQKRNWIDYSKVKNSLFPPTVFGYPGKSKKKKKKRNISIPFNFVDLRNYGLNDISLLFVTKYRKINDLFYFSSSFPPQYSQLSIVFYSVSLHIVLPKFVSFNCFREKLPLVLVTFWRNYGLLELVLWHQKHSK